MRKHYSLSGSLSGSLSELPRFRSHPRTRAGRGFSLIEILGVLAIMGILAGMLAPNIIKQIQSGRGITEDNALEEISRGVKEHIRITGRIPDPNEFSTSTAGWAAQITNYTGLSLDSIASVFPLAGTDTRRRLYLSTNLAAQADLAGFANSITNWGPVFFPNESKIYLVSSSRPDFNLACPPNGSGCQVVSNDYRSNVISSLDSWTKSPNPSTGFFEAPEEITGVTWTNRGEFLHLKIIDVSSYFNAERANQQKIIDTEDENLKEISRSLVLAIRTSGTLPNPNVYPANSGGWVQVGAGFSSLSSAKYQYVFPGISDTERRVYLDPVSGTVPSPLFMPPTGWTSFPAALNLVIVSCSKADLALSCPANGSGGSPVLSDLVDFSKTYVGGTVSAPTSAAAGWEQRGEFLHVNVTPLRNLFSEVTVTVNNPAKRYNLNSGSSTSDVTVAAGDSVVFYVPKGTQIQLKNSAGSSVEQYSTVVSDVAAFTQTTGNNWTLAP